MKPLSACGLLVVGLLPPSMAWAQLGEVQVGALASVGARAVHGTGAGLVLGIAAGRIIYVGGRWTYQFGRAGGADAQEGTTAPTSRVQLFGVDGGILLPAGPFELVPGVSFGAAWFAQRAAGVSSHQRAWEFFVAPSLAVHARLAGLVFIPEFQHVLTGNPNLPEPVARRGPLFVLRLVLPIEVGRIRH